MVYNKLDILLVAGQNTHGSSGSRALPLFSLCETGKDVAKEEKEGKEREGHGERAANRHPACAHSRADPQASDRGALQRSLPGRSHHGAPTQVESLWPGALLAGRHPRAAAVAQQSPRAHATRRSSRPSAGSGCEPGGFLSEVQRLLQRLFHGALHALHRAGGAERSEAVLSRGCPSSEAVLRCGDLRWIALGQDRPPAEDPLAGESRGSSWMPVGGLRHLPRYRDAAVVRRRCGIVGARASHAGCRVPWVWHLGDGRSSVLHDQALSAAPRTELLRTVQEEQVPLVQEDSAAASAPDEWGDDRGLAGKGRSRQRRDGASAYTAEGRGQDLRSVHERRRHGTFDCRGHRHSVPSALAGRAPFFRFEGRAQAREVPRCEPQRGGHAGVCGCDGACGFPNRAGGHSQEAGCPSRRAVDTEAVSIACACLDQGPRSRVHIRGDLQDEPGRQAPQTELESPSRYGRIVGIYTPSTSIGRPKEAKVRSKEAQLEILQQDQRGAEINLAALGLRVTFRWRHVPSTALTFSLWYCQGPRNSRALDREF